MAVGVFDSGLGGLTVLNALEKRLPDVPFVYFADSAHAPYGVRTSDDIFNLTCAAVERLWDEGCDLVILACNTASAAALRRKQHRSATSIARRWYARRAVFHGLVAATVSDWCHYRRKLLIVTAW